MKNRREFHGDSHSPTYKVWTMMKYRCYNENCKDYHRYGGRGIQVCDDWKYSYNMFRAEMGPKPEGKTLDRLDPDGNYTPENCRWATPEEQTHNRRTHGRVKYRGVSSMGTKRVRWRACAVFNGKQTYIGSSVDPKEAARLYDEFVIKHKLPYRLNFPENYS